MSTALTLLALVAAQAPATVDHHAPAPSLIDGPAPASDRAAPTGADRAALAPDTVAVSTPEARRSLTLTLYGQGFGLVSDVRRTALEPGRVRLEFAGVAQGIQESTVRLGTGSGPGELRPVEQTFRWEPLTPESLLEAHLGDTVQVHPRDATGAEGAPVEAELLSLDGGRVLRMEGRVTFGVDGRLSFPEVPTPLGEPPTLAWLLDVEGATEEVSVSYLTGGMGWSADYVLTLGPGGGAPASLTGWVVLENGSGAAWPDARIHLVAGDVRRASGGRDRPVAMAAEAVRAAGPSVSREELFAYHRYSLDREVTLPEGSSKRVSLLEAGGVGLVRRHEVRGSASGYRNQRGGGAAEEPVEVVLELANREEEGLGMPLPAGVVRVYARGDDDAADVGAFLGEDRIGHTPEGATVEIVPGRAFDVTAERVQTDYEALGRCSSESAWEIRLRNAGEEEASVRVVEPVSGEWEVLESSHPYEKVDAGSFRFDLPVPGEGTETVRYRVRVSWC